MWDVAEYVDGETRVGEVDGGLLDEGVGEKMMVRMELLCSGWWVVSGG